MKRANTMNSQRLEGALAESPLDALVAASPENTLYLSGVSVQRHALGYRRLALVLWPRFSEPAFIVCNISESLAKEESWIEDVQSYVEFAQSPIQLLAEVLRGRGLEGKAIGVEKRFITAAQHDELVSLLPTTNFVSCDHIFDWARMIKTDEEVARLREAANLGEEAARRGLGEARAGMTEKAMVDSIVSHSLSQGCAPIASTLASGRNTAHAHWEASAKELKSGDLVRVDICGKYGGYYYSEARTAVVGEPSAEQRETYLQLHNVHRKVASLIAPGVRACDVFSRGRQAFEEEGLPLRFFPSDVGHGLGLAFHERPLMQPSEQRQLETGMTICIEAVYLVPSVSCYQIKNLVYVTNTGNERLSHLHDTSDMFVIED